MAAVRVKNRSLLVDLRDTDIRRGDQALVLGHEGEYRVLRGPLESAARDAPYMGQRIVKGPWEKTTFYGASGERGYFHVIGRVIESSDARR